MRRSLLIAAIVLPQAAALLAAGVATLWWSEELMLWLIHMVGEEHALGAANVIHLENGGQLLTNPGAMMRWTIPVWALGLVQMSAALTLFVFWWASLGSRPARSLLRGSSANPGPRQ